MNSPHRAQPAPAYSPRTERHRSKERGRLRLRDASGTQVDSDDDGGTGLNSQITYTPSTSGTSVPVGPPK